ncbi:uncharacterized protein LOC133307607 isoform X1 [Gastrolobium bilobum]|uniref:uncharacterized protein LOC133307607 isoform X1 n=1 Tax=Gastrolobium bilobum TaxID=150636 RepID=UPI002AB21247|nr:uncharacterized protein LOC133307607 isoform X1 [Gastrolobium bilobum]XP_061364132.1 uncharacterized protein LOC133307607 isoform X1 [Gastrolobium bilobum]
MEPHTVQSINIACNLPKEGIKNSMDTESTEADERKNAKEYSSYSDEMKALSASVINKEFSSKNLRNSLAGTQVGFLKKKLLVLDIKGVLMDIVSPPPKYYRADATIARQANINPFSESETSSSREPIVDFESQDKSKPGSQWHAFLQLLRTKSKKLLAKLHPLSVLKLSRRMSSIMRETILPSCRIDADSSLHMSPWKIFTQHEIQIATNYYLTVGIAIMKLRTLRRLILWIAMISHAMKLKR